MACKRRKGLPHLERSRDFTSHDYQDSKEGYTETAKTISSMWLFEKHLLQYKWILTFKEEKQKTRWEVTHKISVPVDTVSSKRKHDQTLMPTAHGLYSAIAPATAGCTCKQVFFLWPSYEELWRAWDIILQEMSLLARLGFSGFFRNIEKENISFCPPKSLPLLVHSFLNTQWTPIAYLG